MDKKEIFLLTKPPHSDRAKFCMRLIGHSQNGFLYLAGDGVYNLLASDCIRAMSIGRVLACKEDLMARGVQAEEWVIVSTSFYELLVKDMLIEGSKIYAF